VKHFPELLDDRLKPFRGQSMNQNRVQYLKSTHLVSRLPAHPCEQSKSESTRPRVPQPLRDGSTRRHTIAPQNEQQSNPIGLSRCDGASCAYLSEAA
jgi:hypothetical protein